MKKGFLLAFLSVWIFVVSGTYTSFQLYTSNLFKLLKNTNSNLLVNTKSKIEAKQKDLADAKEYLKEIFRESKSYGIESGEINNFLVVDKKIPVMRESKFLLNKVDHFILARKPYDDKHFEIGLSFNNEKYSFLNDYVPEVLYFSLDLVKAEIIFDFQNDLVANIQLSEIFSQAFSESTELNYFS